MLPTKRELGKRGGRAGSNRTDDTDRDMSPQIDTGVSSFGNDRGSNPVEARNEPARESGSLQRYGFLYGCSRDLRNSDKQEQPQMIVLRRVSARLLHVIGGFAAKRRQAGIDRRVSLSFRFALS
ncbi:hypothetical protein T03_1194 [Trichinella britovi]|uniref:Uncharacterized protein n=1 Tax=Trichinella britovi TaxID=45882 RepID=A0A0V1D3J0_TRIBR|nr:hypothetical protein T03_1194 [Trichinella britovi]